MRTLRTLVLVLALTLAACATPSKPCQEGGDVLWDWGPAQPVKGNKQCLQVQGPGGKWINHGRYVIWHPNGKVALEGNFKDGFKEGKWTQFDETGKKVLERVYENGAEAQAAEPALKPTK